MNDGYMGFHFEDDEEDCGEANTPSLEQQVKTLKLVLQGRDDLIWELQQDNGKLHERLRDMQSSSRESITKASRRASLLSKAILGTITMGELAQLDAHIRPIVYRMHANH